MVSPLSVRPAGRPPDHYYFFYKNFSFSGNNVKNWHLQIPDFLRFSESSPNIWVDISATWLKALILKILIREEKIYCNFRSKMLENHIRHQELYSNPQADWVEVVIIWEPFEKQTFLIEPLFQVLPFGSSQRKKT